MRLIGMLLPAALPLALLASAAACSQGGPGAAATAAAPAEPTVHPESGLPIIPLRVKSGGKWHKFRVEVASTPREQSRGLMFRTALGANEGMLFVQDPPRRTAFWMRNTVIPLDIIYIGPDHRVLNIAANAVPYDETPLPAAGPASGVLELNGGRAAELGIGPGSRVEW